MNPENSFNTSQRDLFRKLEYTYEFIELIPGKKLLMRTAEGPFPMETTYLFDKTDNQCTKMTLRNKGNPKGFSKLVADLMESLSAIKGNEQYRLLLTSWTPPVSGLSEIETIIKDGEEYLYKIDETVKKIYSGVESEPFMFCRKALESLTLPPFLVTPIVDKAFRSHLI